MSKTRYQSFAVLSFSCLLAALCLVRAGEYMHGSKDTESIALNLADLAGKGQLETIVQDGLPDNAKGTGFITVSNQAVTLKNIVIPNEKVVENAGKTLRFHVWIQADGVTAKDNLWFASPTVTLDLYDDYGNPLASASSLFKTRGTYPWHCYYVDLTLPQQITLSGKAAVTLSDDLLAMLEAAGDAFEGNDSSLNQPGLYVTFSCYGEGSASFGGLSYEVLAPKQITDRSKWLDEATGTYAPNPEYDELPVILFFGLPADKPWNFLSGNKSFSSLLTIDGLNEYLAANKNDWFHLQKGVASLPYLYVTASALGLAPSFEDNWLESLRSELTYLQDAATGFWKVNGTPNLLVTEAIASNCFSPKALKRADASEVPTPWLALGPDATLPRAAEIIDTLLANRVKDTPGWNEYLLQPEEIGGESRNSTVSLAATTAAVKVLAQAAATFPAGDPRKTAAQNAIRQAYTYAIGTFLVDSRPGLWRENSSSGEISSTGAYFLDLLNATPVLEHRVNPSLPLPTVEVLAETEKGLRLVWKNPPRNLVSVRIYAAPANVKQQFLTEKNIACFIEREDATLRNEDPLIALRKISDAAHTQWNITPEALGCNYLASKIATLPKRLPLGKSDKPVNVEPPAVTLYTVADNVGEEDTSIVFYAVGVNAYGETTDYIPLKPEEE